MKLKCMNVCLKIYQTEKYRSKLEKFFISKYGNKKAKNIILQIKNQYTHTFHFEHINFENVCDLKIYKNFFNTSEKKIIFQNLQSLEYEFTYYKLYGKKVQSPRKMLWFAENQEWTYVFSKNHISGLKAHTFPQFLVDIKERVELVTKEKFNACLINEYVGGDNSIAWHDDDDVWLGKDFIVPSLSFGAVRNFKIRLKDDHKKILDVPTYDGSMMIMMENVQKNCHHSVPKQTKIQEVRYNLTFRKIIPSLVSKMPLAIN